MLAVEIIVGLFFIVGLAGSVIPFLPGTPLIFAGALVYAFATGFTPVGAGRLAILAALAILAYVLEHVAGALGARRYGGSRWAVMGAILGALVGLFFGPLGLVVGPIVGAVALELSRSGHLERSVRSGFGTLVGMVAGVVANFVLALIMIALFLWWVWRG
jgi:uncharacterized protein